jgi:PAS domain S-box-containing protein
VSVADLSTFHNDLELVLGSGGIGVWSSAAQLRGRARLRDPAFLDAPVLADRRIREIFGFGQAQEISHRELLACVHPQDRQRAAACIQAAYRRRAGVWREQLRIVRADGSQRTVELRGSLSVSGAPARRVSLIGVAQDISEQEALKAHLSAEAEAARLAADAKARFLAMMSHEVRTPLSGMLGMLDLMVDTPLSGEQRAMLMRCRESSLSLLAILNDFLDFSKIEDGRFDIQRRPLSLASLMEDVCASFASETARKGIGLSFDVDATLPRLVAGDAVRLRQMLNNLIGNAVKFTHRGGVRVEALRRAEGVIELAVQDTGIGIPAPAARTLFEPFRQVDSATARRYGGAGLGLAIVKQLAELMHGDVRCESAVGVGSRFTVTLPLSPWTLVTGAAPAGGARPDAAPGQSRRVLLADDHPTHREVIARQLLKLGYTCDIAEDGQRAWEMLQDGAPRYAALLLDCRMPRLDGYALTGRLRAREAVKGLPRLPIVMLTAAAQSAEAWRCLQLGADACLSKPLRLEDLGAALSRTLSSAPPGVPDAAVAARAAASAGTRPLYPSLMQLCGGDGAKAAELVRIFVNVTEKDLEAMERAVSSADAPSLHQLAHRLSSACQQFDEDEAVSALQTVEQLAQAGVFGPETLAAYRAARAALDALMARARAFVSSEFPVDHRHRGRSEAFPLGAV